jgi:hypothetical protein
MRALLEHGNGFIIDIAVANTVRERVQAGTHKSLGILHFEDVCGHA